MHILAFLARLSLRLEIRVFRDEPLKYGSYALKVMDQTSELPSRDTNRVKLAHEEGIPTASVEIYGDKWCIFGNNRFEDFVDDPLFFCKRNVFGFSLME